MSITTTHTSPKITPETVAADRRRTRDAAPPRNIINTLKDE
jgi:hypothetical protein